VTWVIRRLLIWSITLAAPFIWRKFQERRRRNNGEES
jgi:hypothetical protein